MILSRNVLEMLERFGLIWQYGVTRKSFDAGGNMCNIQCQVTYAPLCIVTSVD
jgi:hypothetical protein